MKTSFYSAEELSDLNFKHIGKNVLLSRKASYYGEEEIVLGNNVRIDDFCILSGNIKIGNYVHIAAGCFLAGGTKGITIEDFSGCSQNVCIYAMSDDYSGRSLTNPTIPDKFKTLIEGEVIIEKYVIVGSGSVILPSVRINEGCAIGALSLVDKSTDPWKIYSGNPAMVVNIRSRKILELKNEFLTEANV